MSLCQIVMLRKCRRWRMDLYLEQKYQRFRQSQKVSKTFSIHKISFQKSSTLFVTVENADIFAPNINPFSNDDTFKALSFRKDYLNFWSVVQNWYRAGTLTFALISLTVHRKFCKRFLSWYQEIVEHPCQKIWLALTNKVHWFVVALTLYSNMNTMRE